MKITRVVAEAESRLRTEVATDAIQTLDTHGTCRVTIETDEGISGQGSIGFGRILAAPAILAHLINDELAPAIVGEDPFLIRGIRDKLWRLTDYHGTARPRPDGHRRGRSRPLGSRREGVGPAGLAPARGAPRPRACLRDGRLAQLRQRPPQATSAPKRPSRDFVGSR